MSGTQVELDWAATDAGQGGVAALPLDNTNGAGVRDAGYLTDEEILGIEPLSVATGSRRDVIPSDARNLSSIDDDSDVGPARRDSSGKFSPRNDNARGSAPGADGTAGATHDAAAGLVEGAAQMPAWMVALTGDPKVGAEARALWNEHQAFRAAFSSADEARVVADDARALKEIFPGGMSEARALKQGSESLREAAHSIDRIDAAIFSGDVRAQSEVVAELALANPVAFRSLVAEATKLLATLPGNAPAALGHFSQMVEGGQASSAGRSAGPTLRNNGEGWGTQNQNRDQNQNQNQNRNRRFAEHDQTGTQQSGVIPSGARNLSSIDGASRAAQRDSSVASASQPLSRNDNAHVATASTGLAFDPAAYASFERSTNEVVARDVRGSIGDTLTRVLPEGVADGAAKRIGEDIFNEIHRALAGDRTLSEQVGEVLRDRRFGMAEQQRVSSLIAGRAKQLVPSVARRVIGEWTSSVLGTARSKAARQAAAASRVDIAAPGGSLDSMPLRAMSSREVNYASMSDDEILGM